MCITSILLTKTTAAQNEVALSYHRVRGQCFRVVVFVVTILENIARAHMITKRDFILHSSCFCKKCTYL